MKYAAATQQHRPSSPVDPTDPSLRGLQFGWSPMVIVVVHERRPSLTKPS